MLFSRSAAGFVGIAVLLTALTACANSPNGNRLEQIFAADPQLKTNPVTFGQREPSPSPTPGVAIAPPPDFPNEIPRYPDARLLEVTQPTSQNPTGDNSSPQNQPQRLIWATSDPSNLVLNFYQKQFQANNWDLNQPSPEGQENTVEARLNDLLVTVSVVPTSSTTDTSTPTSNQPGGGATDSTRFIIQYERKATATNQTQLPPTTPTGEPGNVSPTPDTQPQNLTTGSQSFTDLNKAPRELQQYITDLAALGVLPLEVNGVKSNQAYAIASFEPGKTISRREFARWLPWGTIDDKAVWGNVPTDDRHC